MIIRVLGGRRLIIEIGGGGDTVTAGLLPSEALILLIYIFLSVEEEEAPGKHSTGGGVG